MPSTRRFLITPRRAISALPVSCPPCQPGPRTGRAVSSCVCVPCPQHARPPLRGFKTRAAGAPPQVLLGCHGSRPGPDARGQGKAGQARRPDLVRPSARRLLFPPTLLRRCRTAARAPRRFTGHWQVHVKTWDCSLDTSLRSRHWRTVQGEAALSNDTCTHTTHTHTHTTHTHTHTYTHTHTHKHTHAHTRTHAHTHTHTHTHAHSSHAHKHTHPTSHRPSPRTASFHPCLACSVPVAAQTPLPRICIPTG